jgi:hypothetical protein
VYWLVEACTCEPKPAPFPTQLQAISDSLQRTKPPCGTTLTFGGQCRATQTQHILTFLTYAPQTKDNSNHQQNLRMRQLVSSPYDAAAVAACSTSSTQLWAGRRSRCEMHSQNMMQCGKAGEAEPLPAALTIMQAQLL